MRNRTRAREAALQVLYQLDLLGPELFEQVDHLLDRLLDPGDSDPTVKRFARDLVMGCWEKRVQLDARVQAIAANWDIGRMAVVDRNILRLATYELLFLSDVPPKVAINEAIDLAKRYSTADSGAFVNGILDRVRAEAEQAVEPVERLNVEPVERLKQDTAQEGAESP